MLYHCCFSKLTSLLPKVYNKLLISCNSFEELETEASCVIAPRTAVDTIGIGGKGAKGGIYKGTFE